MNDLVLKIHSMGLTTVPSKNPTEREYQRYLRELLSLETGMTVAIRFEIGSTLTEMNIEPGEKFLFCQKHFGERASVMMECMKIYREWVFNQNVGWSWSHYKATYARSKQEKLDLIKQYKEKRIKTVEDMREVLARWDESAGIARIPPKRDQIVHVDDFKQGKPSFIEAEYKPNPPTLPPPPNTVNPGPWCECGEPCGDEGTLCLACIEKAKSDPVSDFFSPPQPAGQTVTGTSFKVEGQTITQQPFERSTAVVKQSPPEPVAVAFNPHTGIITYQACAVRKVETPQGFAALAVLGDGRQVEVFIPCAMMPE